MSTWNNEIEARDEIKNLVKKYYNEFKKPEQDKAFEEGIGSRMLPEFMMRKKCVLW